MWLRKLDKCSKSFYTQFTFWFTIKIVLFCFLCGQLHHTNVPYFKNVIVNLIITCSTIRNWFYAENSFFSSLNEFTTKRKLCNFIYLSYFLLRHSIKSRNKIQFLFDSRNTLVYPNLLCKFQKKCIFLPWPAMLLWYSELVFAGKMRGFGRHIKYYVFWM